MRCIFSLLVAITLFHVLHGDMRPSRPQKTVADFAAIEVQEAEKPKDVLINRPSKPEKA
jgi:hypothetical protein